VDGCAALASKNTRGYSARNKVGGGIDTDRVDAAQQKEAVVCCAALPVASVTNVFQ
jgi:hypothetical protein